MTHHSHMGASLIKLVCSKDEVRLHIFLIPKLGINTLQNKQKSLFCIALQKN